MAGNYPDVPGPRIHYDRDGSSFLVSDKTNIRATPSAASYADNDIGTGSSPDGGWMTIIFPRLMDIVGIHAQMYSGGARTVETSVDTTTGIDGTWVSQGTVTQHSANAESIRTGIQTVNYPGIRAIRWQGYTGSSLGNKQRLFHVYGSVSASEEDVDRLAAVNVDDENEVDGAHFDWSDIQQGTDGDITFRVKNLSGTFTASDIVLSHVDGDAVTFSDGGAFSDDLNIGTLVPGAVSGTITVRRSLAADESLGLGYPRFEATPTTWS